MSQEPQLLGIFFQRRCLFNNGSFVPSEKNNKYTAVYTGVLAYSSNLLGGGQKNMFHVHPYV